MRDYRARLAWSILVAAFIVFCALAVSLPLGLRWYLVNSQLEQNARMSTLTGTVVVARPDQFGLVGVTDVLEHIPEGSTITTDGSSEGNLDFLEPRTGQSLGSLHIYGNTAVKLLSIRSPRFSPSPRIHQMTIDLASGRIRSRVSVDVLRPVELTVLTPQGRAIFGQPGSYLVEVFQDETTVVVREGMATVTAMGKSVTLQERERTNFLTGQAPQEDLPAERNLILEGDFANGLQGFWSVRTQKEVADQPDPEITVTTFSGQRAVEFNRPGTGLNWAFGGVRQEINRDVRELSSLRLHLALQILSQDLVNCGALGTECPLMVKLIYQDQSGATREWLQGFYANEDVTGEVPTQCVTCPPPRPEAHVSVSGEGWRTYDSPNLIEAFARANLPAATITAIEIYASGHSFNSLVSEVELLAQE